MIFIRKTIEEIWNGNIDPSSVVGKNNEEIKNVYRLIESNHQRLETALGNEKNILLLEKYKDCYTEYSALLAEQSFCDGFCLAIKIITEAISH